MGQTQLIFTIIIALLSFVLWFWLYDYWIVNSTSITSKFWINFGKIAIGLFTAFLITLPIYTFKSDDAIYLFSIPCFVICLLIGELTFTIKKYFFLKKINKDKEQKVIE